MSQRGESLRTLAAFPRRQPVSLALRAQPPQMSSCGGAKLTTKEISRKLTTTASLQRHPSQPTLVQECMVRSTFSADRALAPSAPDNPAAPARRTFALNSNHPRPLQFRRTDERHSQLQQMLDVCAMHQMLRMQEEISRCARAPAPACAPKHAQRPSPRLLADPRLVCRAVCAQDML